MERFNIRKLLVRSIPVIAVLALLTVGFQNCSSTKFSESPSSSNGTNSVKNTPPPLVLGPFFIQGVSSSNHMIGAALVGERNPTIYWTASENANQYMITITDMNNVVVCPAQPATGLNLLLANCALPDGYYNASATASGVGMTKDAPSFNFYVDAAGPSVLIKNPVVAAQNASIDFQVKPSVGAIVSVICTLSGAATFTSLVDSMCLGKTNKQFAALPYGNYTFTVKAADEFGLTAMSSVAVAIVAPPCTPLVNYNPDCDKRIKADIYFHTNDTGQPVWNSVNMYIAQGIKSGTIYFTDLWIPTRSFTSGFPSVSARTEFFALDMRTKLQTSAMMPAGQYQMGILSDDGSIISTVDANGVDTEVLNQDGYTSTRYGCAPNPITLVDGQKINLHVRYFQGPRDAIALVLMYRPWTQATVNTPIACGTANQNFFGTFPVPVRADPTQRDYPGTDYASLLTQGWMPVPVDSYWNPDLP